MEWLEGKRKSHPGLILAMLRRLPEGCLFSAKLSALAEVENERREAAGEPKPEEPEETPESRLERKVQEHLTWTSQSKLVAQLINRVTDTILIQFPENKRPEYDVIGPESWWPDKQKQKKKPEPAKDSTPVNGVTPSLLTAHFGKMGGYG